MEFQRQVDGRVAIRWMSIGTIVLGTVFLVIGLIMTGDSISTLADAERTQGTVVALDWRTDDTETSSKKHQSDEPAAYPVVEFTSKDGTRRTFRSSTGTNPPSHEKGDRVEVLYSADSPDDARINDFASLWLGPLIFGGLGLLFAGIGTAIAIARRRRS
ncbi:DUF3592 domain-containing protein [Streptomyces cucumeris]|uniref:DUF3592 domain-containing protein n=1 Tax=Streptomyces cucumeris TaxID=2962890 RepID=UPI003D725D6C